MCKRYYYAESNRYGIGTYTMDYRGNRVSAGQLFRFETKEARDSFVDADVWDGNYHRRALTRSEAIGLFGYKAFGDRAIWEESDERQPHKNEIYQWYD